MENLYSIDDCIALIEQFAKKHNVEFQRYGQIGFGRDCVGFTKGNSYIAYNPMSYNDDDYIYEFYNSELSDIAPKNAYHKGDYLAVLGTESNSIRQLAYWVLKLNEMNVSIERYKTGATGAQAIFSGEYAYAIKVPSLDESK